MSELKKLAASDSEVIDELTKLLEDIVFALYDEDTDTISMSMSPLAQSIIVSSVIFFIRDLINDGGMVFKMITTIGTHIQLESLQYADMVGDIDKELETLHKQMDKIKHNMSAKSLINKIKNPDLN